METASSTWAVKRVDGKTAVGISEIHRRCLTAKETLRRFVYIYVPTTRCKARIAIVGIPLQWSCLMQGVVFLASPRLSPPPTASRLLNWVRPCKCGGHKAETTQPSLCCMARSWQRDFSPADWNLHTARRHRQAANSFSRVSLWPMQFFGFYMERQVKYSERLHPGCKYQVIAINKEWYTYLCFV